MALATEMRKLRESKAFYAAAGAGDLAAEKLREVPERLNRFQERTDPKDLTGAAVGYANHVSSRAVEAFDGLAERGKSVVGRVNQQKATQELEGAAKATADRARQTAGTARSTAESARNTARSASKVVGDAAKKTGNDTAAKKTGNESESQ